MKFLIIFLFLQNVILFPTEFCEPLMPNDWKISKNGKETTFRSHFGYSNHFLLRHWRPVLLTDLRLTYDFVLITI